jgi:uncharacterized membrane protein YphA (DoxX/SURF4 family)
MMRPGVLVAAKYALAGVWLTHGLLCKALGAVPRQKRIVARVVGERAAGPATLAVGIGEIALALWILSGREPRLCAAAQTAALASMNFLELRLAYDLLLAPAAMVAANAAFIGLAWCWALAAGR